MNDLDIVNDFKYVVSVLKDWRGMLNLAWMLAKVLIAFFIITFPLWVYLIRRDLMGIK